MSAQVKLTVTTKEERSSGTSVGGHDWTLYAIDVVDDEGVEFHPGVCKTFDDVEVGKAYIFEAVEEENGRMLLKKKRRPNLKDSVDLLRKEVRDLEARIEHLESGGLIN